MTSDSIRHLDLLEAPLAGTTLVEASAGTGKTYAITGLFVRLVVEDRARVDRVLVVTFTKAATAELKERIRRGLGDALLAFSDGMSDDPFLRGLVTRCADRGAAMTRLADALLSFDQVAIHTIHGYCQRALADQAFESGVPFENEILADDGELLAEVVHDFWRREIAGAPDWQVADLLGSGMTPASLCKWLRGHVEKPYVAVRSPPDDAGAARAAAFAAALAVARDAWREGRAAVTELLVGNDALNGTKYRQAQLPDQLEAVAALLAQPFPPWKALDAAKRFAARELAAGIKKGRVAPEHAFFDAWERLLDAATALRDELVLCRRRLYRQLLDYADAELPARKRRRRVLAYSDLLLQLDAALQGPGGARLAAALRERYPAALIDEFQDTDPVQYRIFRAIYGGSALPVTLVGDPKQAIYGFRGADVFAYLDGQRDADARFTLPANWRATPPLIAAVNAVFDGRPAPFLIDEIGFTPVLPAPRERPPLSFDGVADPAPLKFWFVGTDDAGKPVNKGVAEGLSRDATANEIARLLVLARDGRALLDGQPLGGGDIAVLVRSHRQAADVRGALARRGVASVVQAPRSVFSEPAAEQLERLLLALAAPGDARRVRGALATGLVGLDGAALAALAGDDSGWEAWLIRFRGWHRDWQRHGISRALRGLFAELGSAARLLARGDGTRLLTDLRQLVELLHAAQAMHPGIDALVRWFVERRRDADASGDEALQRLESDDLLVQIVTVHASKGLEYPIVFCPYAWGDGVHVAAGDISYSLHDPAAAFAPVLDLAGDPAAEAQARREEVAESLRLLYVALTRAVHRCYVTWGAIKDAGTSPLGWLLHPPPDAFDGSAVAAAREAFKALDDTVLSARLDRLAEAANGAIEVVPIASVVGAALAPEALPDASRLAARSPHRAPRRAWRVSSYSALARGDAQADGAHDHDAAGARLAPLPAGDGIHAFPRGSRPGRCLHAVFERIDFPAALAGGETGIIEAALRAHGYGGRWLGTVEEMVHRVLATPLDGSDGPRLGDIGRNARRDELEFQLPLGEVSSAALRALLARHGHAGPPGQGDSLVGYLHGFIDLVFEADGRYHLVDYKSNWLGPTADDYSPTRLATAMDEGDYHLQYLLYSVALHRHLTVRLPGYDPARHLGDVSYLFLRGIAPGAGQRGIFRVRPGAALIVEVDALLGGGRGSARHA